MYTCKDKSGGEKKKPNFTRRNEQVAEGSFQEEVNSFEWNYSPAHVEFPFPEGEPAGQFQRGSAERLKPNLKTTGSRVARKSSMILMGLNFQQRLT